MRVIFDYSVISHMLDKNKIWGLAKSMIANKDWDALAKMNPYCTRHIKDFHISNGYIFMDHRIFIPEPLRAALMAKLQDGQPGQAQMISKQHISGGPKSPDKS